MIHRTKLSDRSLPAYSRGEETMNMVTHIVGGGLGVLVLAMCLIKSIHQGCARDIVGSVIYGCSMIALYTASSVYHGLLPCFGKKVMQVVDHCTIYFLIAGTYTPILLSAFIPKYPLLGWGMLAGQWIPAVVAATLTAIDLKRYRVVSMICYIFTGWEIIFFLPQAITVLTPAGFGVLLAGGIAYTLGATLYGIGSKHPWFHSVFHIFVVLGSILQFLAIYMFVI